MKRTAYWPWLLLIVPIALGLARLRLDVEVLDLLPQDLKVVQGLKLYQEHFANARELVITIKAKDSDTAETVAQKIADTLRAKTNLVSSVIWEPPWLEHPDQAAEFLAYLWMNQPPAEVHALTNRLAPDKLAQVLQDTREQLASSMSPAEIGRLSYDPLGLTKLPEATAGAAPAFGQGQELFSSPEGTFRIIFIQASHELRTYKDCANWLEEVRAAVGSAESPSSSVKATTEDGNSKVQSPKSERSSSPGEKDAPPQIGYTGRPAFVAEVSHGMQHDVTASVGGTAIIIAVLFYLAHRRWKPMLWLVTLLALILGSTLAIGGLLIGRINVISMGFAAILLGLAVDYAVVHYQEALAHPALSIQQIRRSIAPSIFWAAVTTICAFLVLNLGGLPGLAQLGTLVGLGVALSACVMIFAFLPPLFPARWRPDGTKFRFKNLWVLQSTFSTGEMATSPAVSDSKRKIALRITMLLIVFAIVVLCFGLPSMDQTANALRPRNSAAYMTLDVIKNELNQKRDPLWLLIAGRNEQEVANRVDHVVPILREAEKEKAIGSFTLPVALWPRPEFQKQNRQALVQLASERNIFHEAIKTNGFSDTALALSDRILDTWQIAAATAGPFWPTNDMSRWIFDKVIARTPTNYFFLGFLSPSTNAATARGSLQTLESRLPSEDVWLSGWELLGSGIFSSVKKNMWKLVVPMLSLVMLSLLLAFRAWREVVLSICVLLVSGAVLLSIMRLAGWSWNLLNLMGLPLILGTGVDYSIFMQLALRRYNGDLQVAHKAVGRALLLCGGTAIAGFGSLAWSSNSGMASLGAVCAVGIAGNMLISVLLLPWWWTQLRGRARSNS